MIPCVRAVVSEEKERGHWLQWRPLYSGYTISMDWPPKTATVIEYIWFKLVCDVDGRVRIVELPKPFGA